MAGGASGFRGWRVVGGAFVLAVFAWGIGFYGPGVFIATLSEARGWPVALLSAAITWHFLVSALLVAQLPEWHRRFGIAAVTRAGALGTAAGLLGWGFAPGPGWLFGAATLTGLGWALTSGAAINAMISPWFERRRPQALSLAYNGASVGGIAMTPFWTWLIAGWGFGPATAVVAALLLAVVWPLAGSVLALDPVRLGQRADGAAMGPAAAAAPPALRSRAALLRDPVFRGLSVALAIGLFAQMALVTHLVPLLVPALGVRGAGLAMALVTVCALAGRTATGWVLPPGRGRRVAAAATFGVQAAGSAALLASGGTDVGLLLLGSALFGLGVGNLLSLPPLIVQAEFPAAEVGRVVALLQAINQAVYALAPAAFGGLRAGLSDAAALAAILGVQVLAGALVLRRPG